MNFLWATFTRFDPARDLHAARVELVANHAAFTPPVVIDARMKPGYPRSSSATRRRRARSIGAWKEYFPDGRRGDGRFRSRRIWPSILSR
jgi:hypothetical protein